MCACNMGKKNIFLCASMSDMNRQMDDNFLQPRVNLSGKLKFFIKFMGLERKSSSSTYLWCCMCKNIFNCCRWWSIESSTCFKRFLILFLASAEWKNRIFIFPKWCQHSFYLFTYLLSCSCMLSTHYSFIRQLFSKICSLTILNKILSVCWLLKELKNS